MVPRTSEEWRCLKMSDREKIFTAIRAALDPLPELTPYPEWDRDLAVCRAHPEFATLKELFVHKLAFASGRYVESIAALQALLVEEKSVFGYCDPELLERFQGMEGITFETTFDIAKVNEYSFGITKATLAVAESGSLMLTDRDTSSRLGALAPWIHIAVVKEKDIIADLPTAIERFGDDPSIIWCTGPSKTADVEGILIEGVHGPGIQVGMVV
jgi:L-lactate dehydrogenase complex protein LldG